MVETAALCHDPKVDAPLEVRKPVPNVTLPLLAFMAVQQNPSGRSAGSESVSGALQTRI